ncbi:hypothetical protein ANO11243_071080 [Dothideomycetidae sp. 11243]|nr:hypothetical protein ANO11243_071080 [fungal sp. No.11243]
MTMQTDAFGALPPELKLDILLRLSDHETLDNLLRASPHVWRFFPAYGIKISDRLLDSTPIDRDTKVVVRSLAYLREDCLPVSTLDQLHDRVIYDTISHQACRGGYADEDEAGPIWAEVDGWYMREEDIFSPLQLPKHCSGATIRGLLVTYRHVLHSALDCLDFYRDKLRRSSPQRAVDPAWGYTRARVWQLHAEKPPSVRFPVHVTVARICLLRVAFSGTRRSKRSRIGNENILRGRVWMQ